VSSLVVVSLIASQKELHGLTARIVMEKEQLLVLVSVLGWLMSHLCQLLLAWLVHYWAMHCEESMV